MSSTQELWRQLHLRALQHTSGNPDSTWILVWSRKIPRYTKGCRCNEHWQKWYAKNRPDFSTAEKYFAWTVRAHNAVNERLKKRVYSVDEARELYTSDVSKRESKKK
uniref:thiol oxidase n=1 Tax=viral metagenome TaxID=1070528 RepID=A0A6C0BQF2_9ZZZZ